MTSEPLQHLAAFVKEHAPVLALTGAGISTASGVLDYRDEYGEWKLPQPVTIREFLGSERARARYWLRSMLGWPQFERAGPNAAHRALAAIERGGWLVGTVTQNVDGLHQRAGSRLVIDLHGRNDVVVCTVCGTRQQRAAVQDWLLAHNPGFSRLAADPAPDGHALLRAPELERFQVPSCPSCAGIVRPEVVFFGDSVPREVVERAYRWTDRAGAVMVLGSSLMVYSGLRFCRRADEAGKPVAVVNRGHTRADETAALKLEEPLEVAIPALAEALGERRNEAERVRK